jgi:hypothetical protein
MLAFGATTCDHSTSRAISPAQPPSGAGKLLVEPLPKESTPTLVKVGSPAPFTGCKLY